MATADERDALAEQLEAAQQAGTDLATEVQGSPFTTCCGRHFIFCCSGNAKRIVKDASACFLTARNLTLPRPGVTLASSVC